MSIYLKDKIKEDLEKKYKIDFNELVIFSEAIKEKYIIHENLKLLFDTYVSNNDELISIQCLNRKRIIEQKEYSYISDNDLYKRIEKAFELWYLLYDIMGLEMLWNKEVTGNFDSDYNFFKRIADIYLKETDDLIKEIEEYELGGISNETEKDTNENVCCNKRKIRKERTYPCC